MGPEPPKLGIFSTSTCSFVVPTKTTFSFIPSSRGYRKVRHLPRAHPLQ